MAHISVVDDDVDLDSPTLVEGFPGVGLVGKIAADHLVDALDLSHYANVHCEGVPSIAVYDGAASALESPVRLYASDDGDLLVLQSDVPISPDAATEFAHCFAPWLDDTALPLFLAGMPTEEREGPPAVYGVHAGDAASVVDDADLPSPPERGAVSGPTGALLAHAVETDRRAVGILVEADPQFPDPIAARRVLEAAVHPITGLDVSLAQLAEQAEQIQDARERLARRMQAEEQKSSEAKPMRMFQ